MTLKAISDWLNKIYDFFKLKLNSIIDFFGRFFKWLQDPVSAYVDVEKKILSIISSVKDFINWLKNPAKVYIDIKQKVSLIPSILSQSSIQAFFYILSFFKGTIDKEELLDISKPKSKSSINSAQEEGLHVFTDHNDQEDDHFVFNERGRRAVSFSSAHHDSDNEGSEYDNGYRV